MSGGRGPGTREDVDAPGLEVEVNERVHPTELATVGLVVTVTLAAPAELALELRSFELKQRVPGARGSSERPRMARIAHASLSAPAGRSNIRLAFLGDVRTALEEALSAGTVRARLVVQSRDRSGRVAIANRRITIDSS